MYCRHCGSEMLDEAVLCIKCGHMVDDCILNSKNKEVKTPSKEKQSNDYYSGNVVLLIKCFLLISTVLMGFAFIVSIFVIAAGWADSSAGILCIITSILLAIKAAITCVLFQNLNNEEIISTPYKIFTLIFGSIVSGIILLCVDDDFVIEETSSEE